MRTKLLITALILVRVLAATSQSQSTNPPTMLPPVTVIGQAVPDSLTSPSADTAAEQNRQIPGGFTVKTADEMKKGRTSNFQDLLQGVPGLFMQSENGVEISKVSIRGSGIESDDEPLGVEFLLDGISFDQGDGETIIEDFDVSTLKYAEVYRGATAFKYGSLTMGGAINLVPFTGYDTPAYQLQAEGGSYGFIRGEASVAGVDSNLDYYASLSGRYRDGYRSHSRENTELLFADIGDKISDHLENRFYLTADQENRQLPGGLTQAQMQAGPQQADPLAAPQDYSKQWYYVRLADKISYERDGHELDASIYWWHRELLEKGFYAPDDYEQGIQNYHANDGGINLNSVTHSLLFGRQNILTIGASPAFETEQDHNYANIGGAEGDTIAKDLELSVNVPVYLENQHYLTEKLSLLTGLQAIYVLRHFYDYFNNTSDGDQSHLNNYFGLNPKIGLLYELNDDSQAFINFSRTFQPPSFDNMVTFDDGPGVSLTYTPLQPQHAWTIETGTRGKYGRFDWDLALYHSWVKNELQDLFDDLGQDRGDVNVARSSHEGIEAGLGIELWNSKKAKDETGQSVALNQSYTLNNFHFVNDPVYGNNRLAAIPVHVYEAELMYETPCGFYAGPNVQCNLSRYPVDQANTLYAGTYALLGFKMGYAGNWGKSRFSVFVEAKNLTDEKYAASVDPIGDADAGSQLFHPGDGRSFYGGVTWSW
ncbi:MAG TPA: TonB-dependent receptor [Candidatus Sulfotelmatobacter sp.]|jgi:iron complex outermembrane receptor protein|nr:TonB-dependent receptor [Candidatus Sulfotelmatobacter sp.]